MAKSIKAIECPKCGSTQKTAVRPDVFRCDSCGTEYYLDNDDININHTVRQVPPPVVAPPRPSRMLTGGIALAALLLVLLFRWLTSPPPASYPPVVSAPAVPGTVVAGAPLAEQAPTYQWSVDESQLYLTPDQKPVLFQVGTRRYYPPTIDSSYAVFSDAATGRVLRSVPLPLKPTGLGAHPDFELKPFSTGDLYVVANKAMLLRVDRAAYGVTDVTKSLVSKQPELASGVAVFKPEGEDNGDGFNVFTNDGRNLDFYPLIHKVYTKDTFYDAQTGLRSLRPGSPVRTGFLFSEASSTYPDEKIQLIKYQYRDNGGGPKHAAQFEWDDYGGSGVFTDRSPHRKVLTTPQDLEKARISTYADFTPGQLYFNPRVLYSDAEYVLLSFRPTAAPDSPASVQCLNARTAAIIFTVPFEAGLSPVEALRYPGGFVVRSGNATHTLTLGGRLTPTSKPS